MAILKNIRHGFHSLLLHKMRTFLSTLGVIFGVIAVITMLSIGEGAKRETLSQIEQLGLNSITIRQAELAEEQLLKAREKQSRGLTLKDAFQLHNGVPFVQSFAALKTVEVPVSTTTTQISPEVLAITNGFDSIKGLIVSEGRFIAPLDLKLKNRICILGSDVAQSLGKYGHAGQMIRIDNTEFLIVGVLKNKHWKAGKTSALTSRNFNNTILIPLGLERFFTNIKKTGGETVSEIILQITESSKLLQSAAVVKHLMEKAHNKVDDYQIMIPQELLHQAYRTQYTFNLVLGSIAAISLLVGGIGIMNIMLASVSERTREIGIRRALGANRKHIAYQFLTETFLLTFIGAVLGIISGIGISYFISYIAEWPTVVTTWSILLSLGMATCVGGCSGLYPAFKAAYMNPITALRHN